MNVVESDSREFSLAFGFIVERELLFRFALNESTVNLTSISLEKYLAIVHPTFYNRYIGRRASTLASISAWIFGLATTFPPILSTIKEVKGQCVSYYSSIAAMQAYAVVYFILTCCIPVTIYAFSYISLADVIRRRSKISPSSNSHNPASLVQMNYMKSQMVIIRTLSVVVVCTIVCWTPNRIYFLLAVLRVMRPNIVLKDVTILLAFLGVGVTPFLYVSNMKIAKAYLRDELTSKCLIKANDNSVQEHIDNHV